MITYHFVELGLTYLIAVVMPGPSLALILRNGMIYSRSASIQACFGTIVGTALQSGLILIGINFLDDGSIFFKTWKMASSLYLIYLGFKILFPKKEKSLKTDSAFPNIIDIKQPSYFFEGFLVEFLNPLAFTFFISIMTITINFQALWGMKIIYWFEIIILGAVWFFTVAFVISSKRITFYTRRSNKILENIAGSAFIILGSKMLIW